MFVSDAVFFLMLLKQGGLHLWVGRDGCTVELWEGKGQGAKPQEARKYFLEEVAFVLIFKDR